MRPRSLALLPGLATVTVAQAPNSDGPMLAVPQSISVDDSSWSATQANVRLGESTVYFNRAGLQATDPQGWEPLEDGLPRFEFAAMFPGVDPRLDIDAMSVGLDWVLATPSGAAAVQPGNWGALTFSVTRSTVGTGTIQTESARADGAAGDVFAYVLPGSNLPPELVDRTFRARDSTEINLFGAGGQRGDIDAHDVFMSLVFGENPDLAPEGAQFFFSVSSATLGFVPAAWWSGTKPSGATVLWTRWVNGSWTRPAPRWTHANLGLEDSEDLDALAVDTQSGYLLLSTTSASRDAILFWRPGLGPPVAYHVGSISEPISKRVGLLIRSRDDVDGICSLDPGRGLAGQMQAMIGRPVGRVVAAPASLGGSTYRRLRPADGMPQLVSFMAGWPPGGALPGTWELWRSSPSDQPQFWTSVAGSQRSLSGPFAGDPQQFAIDIDSTIAGRPHYFHWVAKTPGPPPSQDTAFPVLIAAREPPSRLGRPTGFLVDVQAEVARATGNPNFGGILGVAEAHGRYFVTARRDTTGTGNPHMLFEFDGGGQLVASYVQPSQTATSVWGIRDLATDGQFLYGGLEGNTVYAFDLRTSTFSYSHTITVGSGPTTVRALAFDPKGDMGRGSFWTGDFSNQLFEFDRNGAILRSISNSDSIYGAAVDTARGTVWWWSQGGSTQVPSARVVGIEMDTATGLRTGQMFLGDLTIPGTVPGGIAGGCEFHQKNGVPVLLVLTQATSDTIYEVEGRLAHGVSCGPGIGFSGGEPIAGNGGFQIDLLDSDGYVGFLLASLNPAADLLRPPITQYRCLANVELGGSFVIGAASIVGRQASFPLAIPYSTGGAELHLQWVALGPGSLPVYLSHGGGLYVHP